MIETQMIEAFSVPEFMARVKVQPNGCWEWAGRRNGYGYGQVWRNSYAHRVSWRLFRGPIPAGLVIDHLCINPPCVNPAHLEPITQRANVLRSRNVIAGYAKATHCGRGHELAPGNTYIRKRATGGRACRTCMRIWDASRQPRGHH